MMLSVINPLDMGMGFGEFPRGHADRLCCRHQPRYLLKSRRQLSPWQDWIERRNNRNARSCSLSMYEQHPATKTRDVTFGDALNSVLNSFTGSLDLHRPSLGVNPIQWRTDLSKREMHGEVQLPEGITNADDLKMELDEETRMLTLSCAISGGSLGRFWQVSQRLGDSLDLSLLQAYLNIREGKLELTAPLRGELEARQEILNETTVAEDRFPSCVEEKEVCPSSDKVTISTEQLPQEKDADDRKKIDLEIEDIGPDEESDRISISSNEE